MKGEGGGGKGCRMGSVFFLRRLGYYVADGPDSWEMKHWDYFISKFAHFDSRFGFFSYFFFTSYLHFG